MSAAVLDPLGLLATLVLDDAGTLWGDIAEGFQREDAEAILTGTAPSDPRSHFLTRPRGGSKTTDLAAVLLVVLLTQAPRRSTSHAYARDLDQAALLLDELRGLAERSGLVGLLDFGAATVAVRSSGARLRVESADAASAFGRRPYFVVADELAQWPSTRQARTLWEAIVSGLPKRRDSRLVVLTTAGDPVHWSSKVIDNARQSPRWRVSEVPGPLPWADPEDLAEQRRMLPESSYARLHLNRWTAGEDRLVSATDLAACVRLHGSQPYDSRHRYQLGLDLGWVNDATVLTVCHVEQGERGPVVHLDRITVMRGTREHPVQIADVERLAELTSKQYGHAPLRVDPREAVAMAQSLRDRGMTVDDKQLTVQSVGKIGASLHLLLREHRMALPDDPDLLEELSTVRLETTSLGGLRLNHDSGNHDDQAMSLGLAALALIEKPIYETGGISNPNELWAARKMVHPGQSDGTYDPYRGRAIRGPLADVRAAQRNQTEAQRRAGIGLVVPGSANDPGRVRR